MRVLVVRPDGMGDVLLTGPAVRAVAASGADVTFVAGPHGAGAAALPASRELVGDGPYVVLHASASVPARAPSAAKTAAVAGALDLGGRTSLPMLAAVLAGADVVVAPNTGAAHLPAAVGTPVVSLFAPVVPAARWAPYGVPAVIVGRQDAPCAGSRARACPVPGHPCLDLIDTGDVTAAVAGLCGRPAERPAPAEVGR